jgi:hypothetical protein
MLVLVVILLVSGMATKTRASFKRQVKAYQMLATCFQQTLSYTGQWAPTIGSYNNDEYSHAVRFDTNSYQIKIDNCCTQKVTRKILSQIP